MSFETEAELSLTVPRSELQNVQQQIEDSIGTVDVGATDGGSMSAQTTGASGGGGRGGRRVMRLAEERNEHLDDISIYLESVEDTLSEGGLLGGDGGGIATEILGVAGETAGDVAVETGDTVADAISDVLTGTASTALGTSISNAINGSEVSVADTTVPVTPNPLPVSGGGGGGGTTVSPQFDPTFKPTLDVGGEFDLPDLPDLEFGSPGSVRVDESQLPLPVDRDPLQVDAPDAIPVDAPETIPIALDTGGGRMMPESSSQDLRSFREVLSDAGGDAAEGALVGGAGGAVAGAAAGGVGAVPGAALGALAGGSGAFGLEFLQAGMSRIDSAARGRSRSTRSAPRTTTVESNNDIEVRNRYTINVDTDSLVDEVERIVEDAQDEVRDELLDKIETVERDVDDLERQIRRSAR